MTAIDTSTTPSTTTTTLADTGEESANIAAPLTAAATKSSTGTSASSTVNSSAISSLESLVSDTQKQIASAPSDGANPMVKVLEAVVSLVGLLANLVKTFLGNETRKAPATEKSGQSPTTEPKKDSSSSTSTQTGKTGNESVVEKGSSPKESFFDVLQSDAGVVTIRSLDGYVVRAEGKDQAWSITGPDGKTTRIWGDPHVTESDGDRWDFKERGTFIFGNNKATLEVVPAGNGETFSSRLTLYCGDERITISGIDKNKPVITAVSHDGKQHDDSLADGTYYRRTIGEKGEGWEVKTGTKTKEMGH